MQPRQPLGGLVGHRRCPQYPPSPHCLLSHCPAGGSAGPQGSRPPQSCSGSLRSASSCNRNGRGADTWVLSGSGRLGAQTPGFLSLWRGWGGEDHSPLCHPLTGPSAPPEHTQHQGGIGKQEASPHGPQPPQQRQRKGSWERSQEYCGGQGVGEEPPLSWQGTQEAGLLSLTFFRQCGLLLWRGLPQQLCKTPAQSETLPPPSNQCS